MTSSPLHRTVPAAPENVGRLRRELRSFAERTGVREPDAVALAASEALSNAVTHAYVESDDGEIDVVAEVDDEGLELRIADHGVGMRPRADSPGLGVGLPIVAQITDRVEVWATPGGGTTVCMRFGVG